MKKFFAARIDYCIYTCNHCRKELNTERGFKLHLLKNHNIQMKNKNLSYFDGGDKKIEIIH